jgi:hypothetical protein
VNLSTTQAAGSVTMDQVIIGHLDDAASLEVVCQALAAIHGPSYHFSVAHWQGQARLTAQPNRRRYCFVLEATAARIRLVPGQRVRGTPSSGPYQHIEEHWATVTAPIAEELWPGDVLCVDEQPVQVEGSLTVFEVETEATTYPAPTVALLRHLDDRPGGCAAYPGAFRREALPPVRAAAGAPDQRGVNRVNEHTLDMRSDRDPRPQPHHHGPVATGADASVNHSETALVLPRTRYALPPVAEPESGRVVFYPHAATNPAETIVVPVRPGSVIVTPATSAGIAGHCFENAFAMLLAIPGFVSPHVNIGQAGSSKETHSDE